MAANILRSPQAIQTKFTLEDYVKKLQSMVKPRPVRVARTRPVRVALVVELIPKPKSAKHRRRGNAGGRHAGSETLRETVEAYLEWVKKNRTEKFWKRMDRILREDALPALGDLSLDKVLHDLPTRLSGVRQRKLVATVIEWRLKTALNRPRR